MLNTDYFLQWYVVFCIYSYVAGCSEVHRVEKRMKPDLAKDALSPFHAVRTHPSTLS
jgi:hypothetical protein